MESREFGQNDPVTALQKEAVRLLRTEVGRWRNRQLSHRREKVNLDPDFAETVGMLARSVATLTAELRKGGKDMRDAGRKFDKASRVASIRAYLAEQTPAERSKILAELQAGALDG